MRSIIVTVSSYSLVSQNPIDMLDSAIVFSIILGLRRVDAGNATENNIPLTRTEQDNSPSRSRAQDMCRKTGFGPPPGLHRLLKIISGGRTPRSFEHHGVCPGTPLDDQALSSMRVAE
jgi:hypothetical protein